MFYVLDISGTKVTDFSQFILLSFQLTTKEEGVSKDGRAFFFASPTTKAVG